jgi:hypothetical protein
MIRRAAAAAAAAAVLLCARCRHDQAAWRCRICRRRGCEHRMHLPVTRPNLLTGLCDRCFHQPDRGTRC